jgi:hypothetical protein
MILRFLYYMPVCFIDNNLLPTYTRAHLALLWTCRTLRRDALCELQHTLDVATYGGSIDGMHKSLPPGLLDNLRCITFLLAPRRLDLVCLNKMQAL